MRDSGKLDYRERILARRKSLLGIVELHNSCERGIDYSALSGEEDDRCEMYAPGVVQLRYFFFHVVEFLRGGVLRELR